jgi:hypothetical protein
MTVKDAMDTIKLAKECVKFLYQEANAEQDEHIKNCFLESSDLLSEYIDVLEQMKVQRT